LNVTAKDKASGKANSIKITASSGLSKEEVEKMKNEAATHEAEDKAKHEAVEARNIAEQLIYTSEKALKDAGEKVPADLRKGIEDKVADLKLVKDGVDLAAIKKATEALSTEIQKIGQYMNKESGGAGKNPLEDAMNDMKKGGPGGPNSSGGNPGGPSNGKGPETGDDGNVKDAEFKEKK